MWKGIQSDTLILRAIVHLYLLVYQHHLSFQGLSGVQ